MKVDRAELTGTGVAIAFHAALIAALSLSLARVARPPEPPAMEVELVDEVGLQAAAPTPIAAPPPPSQAPELSPTLPMPDVAPPLPTPAPSVTPTPAPRVRPTPPRPVAVTPPTKVQSPKSPPKVSRIGADFLKGIGDNAPSTAPARAAAATISPSAMAGIQQAIRRQVQPCADRQINPGPGASKIKVKLHLVLSRSGALSRAPEVISTSGVDDDNSRYEERVKDLAVAIISGCAPLNLPPELYQTANGGWSNFNMTYSLP